MEKKKVFPLQFFAEGEGAGAPAGAGANEAGNAPAAGAGSESGTGSFRLPDGMKPGRHLRAALEAAGKQEATAGKDAASATDAAKAGTEGAEPPQADAKKESAKTFTQEEVNAMIQKRLRTDKGAQKALDDQNGKLAPLLDAYQAGSVDELVEKMMGDRRTRRLMAENLGVPEERLDDTLRRQASEKARDAELETLRERERQRQQFSEWYKGESECRESYPDFDLQKELDDPQTGSAFRAMLGVESAGFKPTVKNVYEYIHGAELREAAAKKASADAVKQYEDDVRARGRRPVESGAAGGNAAKVTVQIPQNRKERLRYWDAIASGKIKPT